MDRVQAEDVLPRRLLVVAILCAVAWLGVSPGYAADANAGAVGQIEPAGGVVAVSGPPGAVVRTVRVRQGDAVKAGDLLMVLDGGTQAGERDLAAIELQAARKLAASQVAAESLAVKLAEERLKEASRELASYQTLGPQSTSANELARLQAMQDQAQVAFDAEKAKQQVVNQEADRNVQAAAKKFDLAKAALEIHAPSDGTILKIEKRAGQTLGPGPALEMADLRTMYVTCQVYEGDLLEIAPGMKATISSPTLDRSLSGTVEEVSRLVDGRAKLGDVRIKLDRADPANRLVGMEVEVVIAR
jgi:multidrug resistance efflux pump